MKPLLRAISYAAFAAAVLSMAPAVLAETNAEVEKRLQQDFAGATLFLRSSLLGDKLQFDSEGRSENTENGPWTLGAVIAIHDIHFTDSAIEMEGERVWLFYETKQKKFRSASRFGSNRRGSEILPADPREARRFDNKKLAKNNRVHVTILRPPGEPNQQAVLDSMWRVFLSQSTELSEAVPGYWRKLIRGLEGKREELPAPSGEKVFSCLEKGVTPPKPIYQPDPEYTEAARKSKYQAVVVLSCVVTREGKVSDIAIERPAGLGLDERAVDSVRTWKFEPGKKNGEGVPVKIQVEVEFHLY